MVRVLEFDGVSKDYSGPGETVHAVRDVSVTAASGEFITLLGPSGSGKSTLLLLAAGIIAPDDGCICFKGEDISQLDERSSARFRRSHLGFVFQHFNLMPGTALDNVALPLRLDGWHPRDALKRAAEMLDAVGLGQRVDHSTRHLSGGERQRVAIARALAGAPELILADEPTGNLDSERGHRVMQMLQNLCCERGVSVILVSHDPRATSYADRTLLMRDGHLSVATPDFLANSLGAIG